MALFDSRREQQRSLEGEILPHPVDLFLQVLELKRSARQFGMLSLEAHQLKDLIPKVKRSSDAKRITYGF